MTIVSLSTQLDAVNRCLATIAERPVASLSGTLTADTAAALATVTECDLETQSRGWDFNTERKLLTSSGGKIDVPANCVRLAVSRLEYPQFDVTIRDDGGTMRLYDRLHNSFSGFPAQLYATVVILQDFEKTPEHYRRYVTIRAARLFCDRSVSDQARHMYTKEEEIAALRELMRYEKVTAERTIFDTYDAARPILRGRPQYTAANPILFP